MVLYLLGTIVPCTLLEEFPIIPFVETFAEDCTPTVPVDEIADASAYFLSPLLLCPIDRWCLLWYLCNLFFWFFYIFI